MLEFLSITVRWVLCCVRARLLVEMGLHGVLGGLGCGVGGLGTGMMKFSEFVAK